MAGMVSWYGHLPPGAASKSSNHIAPLLSTMPAGAPYSSAIGAAVSQHLGVAAE
jgi:hypothetical protein